MWSTYLICKCIAKKAIASCSVINLSLLHTIPDHPWFHPHPWIMWGEIKNTQHCHNDVQCMLVHVELGVQRCTKLNIYPCSGINSSLLHTRPSLVSVQHGHAYQTILGTYPFCIPDYSWFHPHPWILGGEMNNIQQYTALSQWCAVYALQTSNVDLNNFLLLCSQHFTSGLSQIQFCLVQLVNTCTCTMGTHWWRHITVSI
jgi:hypothetical protein